MFCIVHTQTQILLCTLQRKRSSRVPQAVEEAEPVLVTLRPTPLARAESAFT